MPPRSNDSDRQIIERYTDQPALLPPPLRLRIEELLAQDQVDEAERLMEEKRDDFEEQGAYLRRINQAYFAFYGSYADTPSSIDPIGPKLQTLRDRASSVSDFVRLARGLTSEAELDRLLAGA